MARPERHRRPIGPFFLIALALSAGLFIWQKQQRERALRAAPPPVVERQTIVGATTGAPSVPSPEWVQQQAKELALDGRQRQALAPLVTSYQRELQPLQSQMNAALQAFGAYQSKHQGQRAVPLTDVQREMSRVSELSGRMASLRQSYWTQTAPLLTEAQQAQAKRRWQAHLTPKIPRGDDRP